MLLIKNGSAIIQDSLQKVDILIKNGKIKAIGQDLPIVADALMIDATGLVLMPGLVDIHCHLREPGQTHKGDIESETASAVAGGFVSVCCMPNTTPVVDNSEIVKGIINIAKHKAYCKVYPIACITMGQNGRQLVDFEELKKNGAIAFSDDGRGLANSHLMKEALQQANALGLPIVSHAEDILSSDDGCVNQGINSAKANLKGQPHISEEIMVARDILVAGYTGGHVHICHVSTKGSVELVRQGKRNGVRVTAETCPHYFAVTDDLIIGHNTNAKINPPLRTHEDTKAIIEGLVDGTIDCIATDHAPHAYSEKSTTMQKAAFGSIGFETAFAVGYTYLVKTGVMDIVQLAKLMSQSAAKILRIHSSVIAEDERADITIVDPEEQYTVDAQSSVSKSKNTVFDGYQLQGRVVYTIIDGKIKYVKGKVMGRD